MQIRSSQKGSQIMRFQKVLATNRQSPSNEDEWIRAYKKAVPSAENEDSYDIAAVVTVGGCIGHAMMRQSDNRSHDDDCHMCYNFVSDDELRRFM